MAPRVSCERKKLETLLEFNNFHTQHSSFFCPYTTVVFNGDFELP